MLSHASGGSLFLQYFRLGSSLWCHLNGLFSVTAVWRRGKALDHFSYSSSVVAVNAGSSQPANGGRESMVLQQVLLFADLISPQPRRVLECVTEPHLQRGSGCWPKARIALDPLVLHVPQFSCPVGLIRPGTSSGSVCVARSQLSPVLLNHFASAMTETEHLIRVVFYAAPLSRYEELVCSRSVLHCNLM